MEERNLKSAFDPVAPSGALRKKVLEMKRPAVPGGNRLLRLAAVAATLVILLTAVFWPGRTQDGQLITAPGVMKVYAYDLRGNEEIAELEEYELKSDDSYFLTVYHQAISASWQSRFSFCVPEDYFGEAKITFDVSSEFEEFARSITVEEDEGILMNSRQISEPVMKIKKEVGEKGSFYLDIIIRADGHIVGYGVITFGFDGLACKAYRFDTVCYPMVNGKYQEVTEEFVGEQIKAHKSFEQE